ncbi:unnamed protein product [Nezara viridula]|uniref:Uncharacterized protein n=1 Tax=Nezara viridula TaxID=85310 RepID=A0A9P0H067_NEZVI|nr:unnamed protein product [Nezara viridula]
MSGTKSRQSRRDRCVSARQDPKMEGMGDFMRVNLVETDRTPSYQGLQAVGRYEKITFLMSDEVKYQESLLADLAKEKVTLVIRASRNNNDLKTLEKYGVTLFNIPYRRSYLPRESSMDKFLQLLLKILYENKPVGIVFQVRTLAPFLIGFAMMVVGIHREDSVAKIRQLGVNPSEIQLRYLRRREMELKHRYVQMTFIRRSDNPLARIFYYFVDKFF